MESLLWGMLGFVIFPLWLLVGLVDYWTHQRTDIAHTSGEGESRLHFVQTLEVGLPVLLVLFFEINLLALALVVAAVVAHTFTAYWDVSYASRHRTILPLEQAVHTLLFTLPLFAAAILVVLHWPVVQAPTGLPLRDAAAWSLRLREPPWPPALVTAFLLAALLFGMLPGLAEWRQVRKASRATVPADTGRLNPHAR